MRLVVVESPFAGNVAQNLRYLRACLRDCLKRGESPYASHAIYTQPGVLDDGNAEDRALGIAAGFEWREWADATVVYCDLGTSTGMQYGIAAAESLRAGYGESADRVHPLAYRTLGDGWEERAIAAEAGFLTRWPTS